MADLLFDVFFFFASAQLSSAVPTVPPPVNQTKQPEGQGQGSKSGSGLLTGESTYLLNSN